MKSTMTNQELLKNIIDDLEDTIDDYENDIKRGASRLESYDRKIRIDELKQWKKSLKIILSELEE